MWDNRHYVDGMSNDKAPEDKYRRSGGGQGRPAVAYRKAFTRLSQGQDTPLCTPCLCALCLEGLTLSRAPALHSKASSGHPEPGQGRPPLSLCD